MHRLVQSLYKMPLLQQPNCQRSRKAEPRRGGATTSYCPSNRTPSGQRRNPHFAVNSAFGQSINLLRLSCHGSWRALYISVLSIAVKSQKSIVLADPNDCQPILFSSGNRRFSAQATDDAALLLIERKKLRQVVAGRRRIIGTTRKRRQPCGANLKSGQAQSTGPTTPSVSRDYKKPARLSKACIARRTNWSRDA